MAKKRRKPHNRPRPQQAPRGAGTTTAERPPVTQAEGSTTSSRPQAGATTDRPAQASHHRTERKQLARAEREAARKRIARQAQMRRIAWAGGIGVLIAAGVLFFTRDTSTTRPEGPLPGELATEAPWDANSDQAQERADAIGLPPESPVTMHEHTNLQIFVHGEPVAIPTEIGIDRSGAQPYVASLHTHEDSGTIHIESSVSRTFTLGEFFDIWGVRLTPSCMGGYCNDETNRLRVFVAGQEPPDGITIREVALTDQQVVVVAFGTEDEIPDPIPTEFDFGSVPQ